MRPPPESGGYVQVRGAGCPHLRASMRPPPESGGYGEFLVMESRENKASMRPPPESGGYDSVGGLSTPQYSSFNEAAARKRRIQRSRNASCAKGFRACLREPWGMITQLPSFFAQSRLTTNVTPYFYEIFYETSGSGGVWHHIASR